MGESFAVSMQGLPPQQRAFRLVNASHGSQYALREAFGDEVRLRDQTL